jgi:hypothetical protein
MSIKNQITKNQVSAEIDTTLDQGEIVDYKINKKLADKEYYQKNKEKIREHNKLRKEERSIYDKKYNQEHKEQIKIKNKRYKDAHKEEIKDYNKRYNDTNNEKWKEYYSRGDEYVQKYLNKSKCLICSDTDTNHMCFHHINPEEKDKNIAQIKQCSISKIQKEIDKCIILCKNCHMKLHSALKNRKTKPTKAQQYAIEYKKNIGCNICGENMSVCLQFHHKNPENKYKGINQTSDVEIIKKEIEKCSVLCANCHTDIHINGVNQNEY